MILHIVSNIEYGTCIITRKQKQSKTMKAVKCAMVLGLGSSGVLGMEQISIANTATHKKAADLAAAAVHS